MECNTATDTKKPAFDETNARANNQTMHASGVAGEQAKNTTSRRHVMVGVITLRAIDVLPWGRCR
ncbi:hypothetical protein CA13_09010 [Planctomycetes bacterium CA13]|uniref:Uncharacterized protein n=1 Tax=Novipirellula herctigrandis TaxID=2527986 RepID=A0A5C5YWS9_9BACT|nr:hypothetical protein CA13_09010 [Planctomycetes bacterium CA13]